VPGRVSENGLDLLRKHGGPLRVRPPPATSRVSKLPPDPGSTSFCGALGFCGYLSSPGNDRYPQNVKCHTERASVPRVFDRYGRSVGRRGRSAETGYRMGSTTGIYSTPRLRLRAGHGLWAHNAPVGQPDHRFCDTLPDNTWDSISDADNMLDPTNNQQPTSSNARTCWIQPALTTTIGGAQIVPGAGTRFRSGRAAYSSSSTDMSNKEAADTLTPPMARVRTLSAWVAGGT
jgi:hypothetical protein